MSRSGDPTGMIRAVLQGPFLTRAEAAERSGLSADDMPFRPDLLRIGGRSLPEAYFQFQFGPAGIRNEIGTIVLAMRGSFDDIAIADWLVRSNPALRGERPLDRLLRTQATATVLEALHATAPESATETAAAAVTDPATVRAQLVSPHRRGLRSPHRPISGRTAASH